MSNLRYTITLDFVGDSKTEFYQIISPSGSAWGVSMPLEQALRVVKKLNKEEYNE
jgi:hypothetical protein